MALVVVVGNLGRDSEIKVTQSGKALLSFSLAENQNIKGDNRTTWFSCTVWGESRAKALVDKLGKGTRVQVHGDLSLREWETTGGEKRQSLEINVENVRILDKVEPEAATSEGADPLDDDIPY